MSEKSIDRLEAALLNFVERVTDGKTATSETEIAVLPEVAKVLVLIKIFNS